MAGSSNGISRWMRVNRLFTLSSRQSCMKRSPASGRASEEPLRSEPWHAAQWLS